MWPGSYASIVRIHSPWNLGSILLVCLAAIRLRGAWPELPRGFRLIACRSYASVRDRAARLSDVRDSLQINLGLLHPWWPGIEGCLGLRS